MKSRDKAEYGDFQTPPALAEEVCRVVAASGCLARAPATVVEPTCGVGAILRAAADAFPTADAVGFERNEDYVAAAARAVPSARVHRANFFERDWGAWATTAAEPILAIGNPPWVTNAELSGLGSANLPAKTNAGGRLAGLDAVTGKSNFDISEWMLLELARALDGREGALAMLCKTTVARKVLDALWRDGCQTGTARTYRIDAGKHFGAAVDACLLLVPFTPGAAATECRHFETLSAPQPTATFGRVDEQLVADVELYRRHAHLAGAPGARAWRSGVKHDCARVMELRRENGSWRNGLGNHVDIEDDLVFPLLKSSDVAHGRQPTRSMIVPQRRVGEPTDPLREQLPRTWRYLEAHGELLDRRRSSIYRGRPRFSIFGVGHYTFAPWKVAVSGFYKSFVFRCVGPVDGKPVVFDDTCYFVSCASEAEARTLAERLNGAAAQEFFAARVFWDAKRPVTSGLLRSLDLDRLVAAGSEPASLAP